MVIAMVYSVVGISVWFMFAEEVVLNKSLLGKLFMIGAISAFVRIYNLLK